MDGGAVSFTSISCGLTGEGMIRDKDIKICGVQISIDTDES